MRTRAVAVGRALSIGVWMAATAYGGTTHASVDVAAPEAREQVGELWVSTEGRRRVRSGRAEGASIHDPWIPAARSEDATARDALAAFERATFVRSGPASGSASAPASASSTPVVAVAPRLWMKDLVLPGLPIRWTRRVVEYLTYFKDNPSGQSLMRGWMRRAGRYEGKLRAVFKEAGVPEDLVFVALAESGFNPTVRSHVGAAGLWQFMEPTGQVYGLTVDYWVDERHDIVKSTRAAALYLADLKARFGSWELALAAYNAGYGLLMVTIERHNTNDFWALCDLESGLPHATTNYVPKIFAAAVVGRNRAAFGVQDKDIEPLPAVDWIDVKVPPKTSLSQLAKAIGESASLIEELNAQYVRGRTPPRGSASVRIPRASKEAFERAYPTLRDEVTALREHTMLHGDRLASIAARFGTTEDELRKLNGVRDAAELTGGVTIVLPASADVLDKTTPATAPEPPLLAAVPPLEASNEQRIVYFRANRATAPRDLVAAFGVPWTAIVRWNQLDPLARLQSGQVLQMLVPAAFDSVARNVALVPPGELKVVVRGSREHIEEGLARRGLERRAYKAVRGDTLAKIARRFDLTVGDIARINGFSRSHDPAAGELVVVYIASKQRSGTVRAPDPPAPPPRTPSTAQSASVPTKKVPSKAALPRTRTPSTADTARVPASGTTQR